MNFNPYGQGFGNGPGNGFFFSNEGALSQAQYDAAQQYMPNALQQPVIDRVQEAARDRFIQEELRNRHQFVDNSRAGNQAFRDNCRVIHKPMNYFNKPPENKIYPN